MADPVLPDLVAAAKSGKRLDVLVALRDRIAAEIQAGVPARDLASLSLRLDHITEQIDALKEPEERSPADELQRRRASRRADSEAGDPAAR